MKYKYCMECKKPIGCKSTFNEAVVLGKTHKKELKDICKKSAPEDFDQGYCRECFLKLRRQFGKTDCDVKCAKNTNGHCEDLLKNIEQVR